MNKFQLSVLAILCVLLTPIVMADTTVTVSGTVVIPPCRIVNAATNDDSPINVDFGDVAISKIDGTEFSKPIPWKIVCDSSVDMSVTDFALYARGDVSDFDSTAVKTSIDGLGIQLKFGPLGMEINSIYSTPHWVSADTFPVSAVPVKKSNVELAAGAFTATASLVLSYE